MFSHKISKYLLSIWYDVIQICKKKKKNGDRNKTLSQIVSIFHGSDGRPTRSFLVAVFFSSISISLSMFYIIRKALIGTGY